jgi:carbamoyltransferase
MGLFPYGEPNKAPKIYGNFGGNKDLFTSTYPNGALVNEEGYAELNDRVYDPKVIHRSVTDPNDQRQLQRYEQQMLEANAEDVTKLASRRNMAYNVQTESQQLVLDLILKSIKRTGNKNIVISGGYGLNCVANYFYLQHLPAGVKIYVEPVSNDAGTAMGAALYHYYKTSQDTKVRSKDDVLHLINAIEKVWKVNTRDVQRHRQL